MLGNNDVLTLVPGREREMSVQGSAQGKYWPLRVEGTSAVLVSAARLRALSLIRSPSTMAARMRRSEPRLMMITTSQLRPASGSLSSLS